jgi:hypothetical protein
VRRRRVDARRSCMVKIVGEVDGEDVVWLREGPSWTWDLGAGELCG